VQSTHLLDIAGQHNTFFRRLNLDTRNIITHTFPSLHWTTCTRTKVVRSRLYVGRCIKKLWKRVPVNFGSSYETYKKDGVALHLSRDIRSKHDLICLKHLGIAAQTALPNTEPCLADCHVELTQLPLDSLTFHYTTVVPGSRYISHPAILYAAITRPSKRRFLDLRSNLQDLMGLWHC
jgi:hypothetical protein